VLSLLKRFVIRHSVTVLLDLFGVVFAFYMALALRFSGRTPLNYFVQFRQYVLLIALVYCLVNGLLGLYSRIWRYASSQEIMPIIESVTTSTLLVAAVDLLGWVQRPLPLSVVLAGGLFTLGAFAANRYRSRLIRGLLRRWKSQTAYSSAGAATRTLIVGAGECGQLLAWRLQNQEEGTRYEIIGFVDDDPHKHGMRVHGIKVLGGRQAISGIVQQEAVALIVIAIHTISGEDFRAILSICQSTSARIKTLPNIFESLESLSDASLLRDITIEDLVGRKPVSIDRRACRRLLRDKVVLVTGAGGSIGSELCRQIVQLKPRLLVMLDNNETGLYDLDSELRASVGVRGSRTDAMLSRLRYVVADVTQRRRIEGIFRQYRPQIILHAAAYKHVPLMEEHPAEAIRVNIGGTLVLLELGAAYGTEHFVFVSTDKAVEPVSVMGVTKSVGEMLIASVGPGSGMIATAVRFGNVLGSRGSVVPVFQKQIDAGGPVTVTHLEATRFFMSIAEAASLILQAASVARGGEVLILDMGEQVSIVDLAHKMIRLRGLRVGQDMAIIYTGMRPGEKLHEVLVASFEEKYSTSHPKIFCVRSKNDVDRTILLSEIHDLLSLAEQEAPRADLIERLFAIARTPHV